MQSWCIDVQGTVGLTHVVSAFQLKSRMYSQRYVMVTNLWDPIYTRWKCKGDGTLHGFLMGFRALDFD